MFLTLCRACKYKLNIEIMHIRFTKFSSLPVTNPVYHILIHFCTFQNTKFKITHKIQRQQIFCSNQPYESKNLYDSKNCLNNSRTIQVCIWNEQSSLPYATVKRPCSHLLIVMTKQTYTLAWGRT